MGRGARVSRPAGSARIPGPAAVGLVVAMLVASWGISYALGGAGKVPPHVFYVPILFAAARFGHVGAVVVALVAGLLAGPALPSDVGLGTAQELSDWTVRSGFFVAMGLLMATAFERLRRSEGTATSRVRRLANLQLIDREILGGGTLREIADATLARLRELIPCDRASLGLIEPAGVRVVSTDAAPGTGPEPGAVVAIGLPDLERVEVLLVPDVESSSSVPAGVRSLLLGSGLRSALIGPIRVGGKLEGGLAVLSRTPEAFDDEDAEVVREVAAQLALALEQTRLRERLEERARELERRVLELGRAEAVRRTLLRRLVATEEIERQELAESLHDDPIQTMTAVGMRLELLRPGIEDAAQTERLDEIVGLVREAIARLRGLVFELHPPTLERDGLAPAIRTVLEQTFPGDRPGWSLDGELAAEPPMDVRWIAYRVVREAIANVRKHALASRVEVSLADVEDGIVVRVRDDGTGFDPARVAERPGHLGLSSMRERVEVAGGWLRIESTEGSGTLVEFWLPTVGEGA